MRTRKTHQQATLAIVAMVASSLTLLAAPIPDELPDPDGNPADMKKPVQVFILMGQSNMVGCGKVAGGEGALENACKNKGLYPYLVDKDGNWTVRNDVRNVFVLCSGNNPAKDYVNDWMTVKGLKNIGPEIGIGHYVGEATAAPVLILKSCCGNRSLGWDLLPPGSKPYEHGGKMQAGYRGTPDDPGGDTGGDMSKGWYAGCQYDGDVAAAKQVLKNLDKYYPGAKEYQVAGFFWWQGDKDRRNPAHFEQYEKNLIRLIKALRKDFDAPDARFVTASLGQTAKGSKGGDGVILDAMEAVSKSDDPELKGEVAFLYTHPLSKGGGSSGHYGGNAETYMNVGEGMGRAMVELLEKKKATRTGPASTRPVVREARRLAPGKADALINALLKELVGLTDSGQLKPTRISLSLTSAKVSFVSAQGDNTLTYQSDAGKTVTIPARDLKPVDFANLALVLAQFKPDSHDALALAGVYLECLGRVKLADQKYAEAGSESTAKMTSLFFEPRGE